MYWFSYWAIGVIPALILLSGLHMLRAKSYIIPFDDFADYARFAFFWPLSAPWVVFLYVMVFIASKLGIVKDTDYLDTSVSIQDPKI